MTIDKQNGNVAYNDELHSYWNVNDNERYISVTTLIHQYQRPYDSDFWSSYKALERLLPKDVWAIEKKSLNKTKQFSMDILDAHGIKVNDFNREKQNILDEWEKKKVESCERGTKIHAALENSMYKAGSNISLAKRYGIGGKFECKKDYLPLDLECGVYPEYLISYTSDDGLLRVAGQIDLLIKDGNDIYIADYKTNEEIKQKSFYDSAKKSSERMLYPLNDLDDVNYWHYTMQLSTYAWMIEKTNPDFKIKDLIMIHFDHQGKETTYHLDYLKDNVERMFAHYKQQLVHKKQIDSRKRIEY